MEKESKNFYGIKTDKPVLESTPIYKNYFLGLFGENYSLPELLELFRRKQLIDSGDFSEIDGLNKTDSTAKKLTDWYLKPKAGFLNG